MFNKTLLIFSVLLVIGCGIKGKPEPPSSPPELGRGKPTYKGATKKLIEETLIEEDTEEKKEKKNEK